MRKIRKGDTVIVITGKDKGKRGEVSKVVDANLVVVKGVNVVKKHQKPNPMKNEVGGIISVEMPLQVSNIALFNPKTEKADRVGIRIEADGRKVRVFKSSGDVVPAVGS